MTASSPTRSWFRGVSGTLARRGLRLTAPALTAICTDTSLLADFNNLLNHASERRLKGWSLDFALSSVINDSLLAASDLRRGASQW